MFDRGMIREGMTVHSADGEKLGKIQSCSDSTFIIEKGFFLPTDYVCRYDDVSSIEGDDVRLAVTKDEFRRREVGSDADVTTRGTATGSDPGWAGSEFGGLGVDRADRAAAGPDPANQLDPGLRAAGEWRTERAGDLRREGEELRVPVAETMPVREEEVEIRKRPVVKEEVRLRKERFVEHRAADADVPREEVGVEGDEFRREGRGDGLPEDRAAGRRDPDDTV